MPGRDGDRSAAGALLQRRLRAAFTERLGYKAAALFFAVVLWFVVSAVVAFVRAIFEPEARGVRMVVALVEFVFGILILALPKLSLGTLAVLCGIAFAVRGAGLIAAGLELRRMGEVPNGGIDTAAVAAEH